MLILSVKRASPHAIKYSSYIQCTNSEYNSMSSVAGRARSAWHLKVFYEAARKLLKQTAKPTGFLLTPVF